MKKNVCYALSYIICDADKNTFIQLYPEITNLEDVISLEDMLLEKVKPGTFSDKQKLLLAGYLCLYAILSEGRVSKDKLNNLLKHLGVRSDYTLIVNRDLKKLDVKNFQNISSAIEIVINPPEPISNWLTLLVAGALSTGEYIPRQKIEDLSAEEYEHPLDRKFLRVLQKTKGFDFLLRKLFEHGFERFTTIQYTGSQLKLGPKQMPQIYEMVCDACAILGIESVPDVYIEHGFINAFTIGDVNPILVLSSGCCSMLSYFELMFIIGHELGHIKSRHCLYHLMGTLVADGAFTALANTLNTVTLGVSSAMLAGIEVALLNWQRASELTADRAGLLCCQDMDAAMRCMMKMAGASPAYYSSMNIEAFKEQAREFKDLNLSIRDKVIKTLSIMGSTHPWTIMRGHELLKWYEGGEYAKVIERQTQVTNDTTLRIEREHPEGDPVNYCNQCGTHIKPEAKFCTKCGSPVTTE